MLLPSVNAERMVLLLLLLLEQLLAVANTVAERC